MTEKESTCVSYKCEDFHARKSQQGVFKAVSITCRTFDDRILCPWTDGRMTEINTQVNKYPALLMILSPLLSEAGPMINAENPGDSMVQGERM